jgi:hypothetical protein
MEPEDWQRFTHPRFRVEFRYPDVTPRGRPVKRIEEQVDDHRGEMERVHISSPDRRELYFELARFGGITPKDEYANHKQYLEQRFGADSITALTETSLQDRPAWTYAFRWDGEEGPKERAALLLQVGDDTYRVIYDPRSALNDQVIATLRIVERAGSAR